MNLNEQRKWYEEWHGADKPDLPVEALKQRMRLEAIGASLARLTYNRVLVIGCGAGDELELLNKSYVTAFDLSAGAVRRAKMLFPANHYLQADGMHLPFASSSFDLVIASEVIEHILEPEKMLAEMHRVLRPGGQVLLTTPNWRSFFGLARWGAERMLGQPIASDNQPVDRWSTLQSLNRLLGSARLISVSWNGAWYYPPTGLGMKRLPDRPLAAVFRRLLPLERALRDFLPGWGHLLVVVARRQS